MRTEGTAHFRAALLLTGVFVLGLICGASLLYVGQRSVRKRPPPRHGGRPPIERLSEDLGLNPEQRNAIRQIGEERKQRLDQLLEESRDAIRELLTPEQRKKFDRHQPPHLRPGAPHGPPPHGGPGRRHRPPPPHHRRKPPPKRHGGGP